MLNVGVRPLSDVVGGVTLSEDNPLDFHDETKSVLVITLKYLFIVWNTKNFVYHLHQNDFCQ